VTNQTRGAFEVVTFSLNIQVLQGLDFSSPFFVQKYFDFFLNVLVHLGLVFYTDHTMSNHGGERHAHLFPKS